jgi:hypothetical protein
MAMETIADVANSCLANPSYDPLSHRLDSLAANITLPEQPNVPFLDNAHTIVVPIPTTRDPCLPTTGQLLQYINIFVDNFIALASVLTL